MSNQYTKLYDEMRRNPHVSPFASIVGALGALIQARKNWNYASKKEGELGWRAGWTNLKLFYDVTKTKKNMAILIPMYNSVIAISSNLNDPLIDHNDLLQNILETLDQGDINKLTDGHSKELLNHIRNDIEKVLAIKFEDVPEKQVHRLNKS